MIHLASRSSRWSVVSLLIVCIATTIAIVTKPEPKRGRVVVTDTYVEILDHVRFVGDTIATPSLRTLDAIADTLIGNPSIQLVEVQHTTEARAQKIVDYLVGQGVEPERLTAGVSPGAYSGFVIVKRTSDE